MRTALEESTLFIWALRMWKRRMVMLYVCTRSCLSTDKAPAVLFLSWSGNLGLRLVAGDAQRLPARGSDETGDYVAVSNHGEKEHLEAMYS